MTSIIIRPAKQSFVGGDSFRRPRVCGCLSAKGFSSHSRKRGAFTLLEVILALAIGGMVMALVAMAIDIYMSMSTSGRRQVEQAQLARALMNQIADDLRSAVVYQPQDFSSIEALLSGGLAGGAGGDGSGSGNGDGSGNGNGDGSGNGGEGNGSGNPAGGAANGGKTSSGGKTSGGKPSTGGANGGAAAGGNQGTANQGTASGASAATETEEESPTMPGLFGDMYSLQVDTSRLPRVDQYEQMMSGSGATIDLPSDVKTVVYALGELPADADVGVAMEKAAPGPNGAPQALLRSSGDRSVVQFHMSSGGGAVTLGTDVLATEVTKLQFGYFDGTDWLDYWDSTEQGGPPVAVEILLTLASPASGGTFQQVASALGSAAPEIVETTYRQVVYLPVAKPATSDQAAGTTGGAP